VPTGLAYGEDAAAAAVYGYSGAGIDVLPPAKRHRLSNGSAVAAATAGSADPVEFQQLFNVQQQQQHGLASMPSWFAAGLADAETGSSGAAGPLDAQLLDEQLLLQHSLSPGSVRLPRSSLGLLGQVPVQQQGQSAAAAAAEYASSSQMEQQQQQQGLQQGGVEVQQGVGAAALPGSAAAAAGEDSKQAAISAVGEVALGASNKE
jgi:hypothetical protein